MSRAALPPGNTPPPPPARTPPPRGTPPPVTQGAPHSHLPPLLSVVSPVSVAPPPSLWPPRPLVVVVAENAKPTEGAPPRITPNSPCADCDPGNGQAPTGDALYAASRLREQNETGAATGEVNLGSRNYSWSMGLVSMAGRAGLDVNLSRR